MSLIQGCRFAVKVARSCVRSSCHKTCVYRRWLNNRRQNQGTELLSLQIFSVVRVRYCSTEASSQSETEVGSQSDAEVKDKTKDIDSDTLDTFVSKLVDSETKAFIKEAEASENGRSQTELELEGKDKQAERKVKIRVQSEGKLADKENDFAEKIRLKELIYEINSAESASQLLALMKQWSSNEYFDDSNTQTLLQNCLHKMKSFINPEELPTSEFFHVFLETVNTHFGFKNANDHLLAELLSSVLQGNEGGGEVEDKIINEVLQRIPGCTLKSALLYLSSVKGKATSTGRKALEKEAHSKLVSSISVIDNPGLLYDVMFEVNMSPQVLQNFEKKAMQLLDLMQPVDLYRAFYFLARNNRMKSHMLISAIKTKLISRPISFDKLKIRNMFYACSVLRVYDERLLTALSENLIEVLLGEEDLDIKKSVALPVLMSCYRLGWNYQELTGLLMKITEASSARLTQVEKLNLLNIIGRFKLKECEKLVLELIEDSGKLKESDPDLFLQTVHAFAIMKCADADMVMQVLNEDFYSPLMARLKDAPLYKVEKAKLTLINLLGYLNTTLSVQHTFPDFEAWRTQLQEKIRESELVGMAQAVGQGLNTIAPLATYTNKNVVSKYGHIIDFEVFIDETGMVRRLKSVQDSDIKVWIKLLNFKDYVKGSKEHQLTADVELMKEQLLAEHRCTVFIPYYEWVTKTRAYQQTNYLETRVKTTLSECVNGKEPAES